MLRSKCTVERWNLLQMITVHGLTLLVLLIDGWFCHRYGLGQAYELLDLFHYSVYYYQKAAGIRPYDARMWVALGMSFEKLDQITQAKSCYARAVANKDSDGIAVFRLAKLYQEKEPDKAAEHFQLYWRDRSRVCTW